MATERLIFRTSITSCKEKVFEEMANPLNIIGLQPQITSVTIESEEDNETFGFFRYRIKEQYRFFGLTLWRNSVVVQSRIDRKQCRIRNTAISQGGVQLKIEYAFDEFQGATHVREYMDIRCPSLMRSWICNIATNMQNKMLENLKRRLEASASVSS